MSKMLNIALVDVDGPLHMPAYCMDWSTLSEEECSNILHAMNFSSSNRRRGLQCD